MNVLTQSTQHFLAHMDTLFLESQREALWTTKDHLLLPLHQDVLHPDSASNPVLISTDAHTDKLLPLGIHHSVCI